MGHDDVKVAVLGCGAWGINHVRVWHDLGRLAMVCDPDPRRLAELKENFPDVRRTSDPDDVFSSDDIAGVVIATPAVTHARARPGRARRGQGRARREAARRRGRRRGEGRRPRRPPASGS